MLTLKWVPGGAPEPLNLSWNGRGQPHAQLSKIVIDFRSHFGSLGTPWGPLSEYLGRLSGISLNIVELLYGCFPSGCSFLLVLTLKLPKKVSFRSCPDGLNHSNFCGCLTFWRFYVKSALRPSLDPFRLPFWNCLGSSWAQLRHPGRLLRPFWQTV